MSNGRYIKASPDKEYIWLVWILKNLDVEGVRKLHSVHHTSKSALNCEQMLPKNHLQYYILEKRELLDE